jgi:hypothetical protein
MTPERITLRSGRVIESPLERLVEFAELDGTYQGYDAISPEPFELNALDVQLANRIIARMSHEVSARLLARSGEGAAALRRVPTTATLAVPAEQVDWDALYELYRALSGLPGIGVARMTKVLHRKRPALVPILDDVVRSYLRSVEPLAATGDTANQALVLTRAYHRELHHQLAELTELRDALDGRGIQLSECRILDILLWAYSGVYTPLWQRRATSATPPDPRPRHRPSGAVMPLNPWSRLPAALTRFVDDDDGYLAWIRDHPAGWVLNCERHPKATYLTLHQADCTHLIPRPGWSNLTTTFTKVCGTSPGPFDEWLATTLGTQPDRCPTCNS